MTEKSALNDLLSRVKAGVGKGPTKTTFMPIEIKPAVKAGS